MSTPLSADLMLLVWSVALCVIQMLIAGGAKKVQVGAAALAGNRENLPAATGIAGRAQRAHSNMLENIGLFAALVLVAHVSGRANEMTALGAQLFFWGRVVYAVVYLAGIPWLRTGVWFVSMVGLVLIFLQLL